MSGWIKRIVSELGCGGLALLTLLETVFPPLPSEIILPLGGFLARLVPGVRSLISIPAGMCGMELAPFLIYTLLGTAMWSGALSYAGMLLGERYRRVSTVLQWATYGMIALVAVALVRWVVKRKKAGEHEGYRRGHWVINVMF